MSDNFDEATQKAIDKIEKLMRLSASNPNEAEAASALAKAQELLAAYNLDMAVIEQSSGESGKRTDEQVSGGMYKYQRQLWRSISQLNWCMYWLQKRRVREGSIQAKRRRTMTHEIRLVGRKVNVIATKNMANYLNGTIERLCRERLGGEAAKQFFSRDAVAFREGIADRVIDKIQKRRNDIMDEENRKAAEAARQASRDGVNLGTALTLAGINEREKQANYDFLHGEGAWAKMKAAEAEWEAEWAERRRQQALAEAAAEKVYAAWAEAHPEEAKKEAAKERARQRAADQRSERGGGRRYRFRETTEDMRKSSGAYHAGWEAGANVSIDQQMGTNIAGRLK